jgi:CheY-like chemotaxis protein
MEGERGLAARPKGTDVALRQAGFLASLSDELRAPLNNVLTLAKLLADNEASNLSAQQVDFAQTIYAAGTGLLSAIDDIVDLAGIDAAQVASPEVAEQTFGELDEYLRRTFRHAARERRIDFDVELAPDLPPAMRTDGRLLRHLLRNLLAMAFKLVRGGRVALAIAPDGANAVFDIRHGGAGADSPQATGVVLPICREIAHSLGGRIDFAGMERGELRYVLVLPLALDGRGGMAPPAADDAVAIRPATVNRSGEAVMLIAEGNAQVASVMLDLVRANGYQGVVAMDLGTLRVLLRELAPEAILIGGSLLDIDGWSALELLKRDARTRRIPVSMNCPDAHRYLTLQIDARAEGAASAEQMLAALDAAAGRRVDRLLLAGVGLSDGLAARAPRSAANAAEAIEALRRESFDGLLIGPGLDIGSLEMVRAIGAAGLRMDDLAIAMVHATGLDVAVLRQRARLEDILGETALHLGRNFGSRRWETQRAARQREAFPELAGRTALIVDDDIYNVYAMTGALEQQGMSVVLAQGAREGLAALRDAPAVDVVLIDISMPEIDADSIVHAMRATHEGTLPIIAVTARAMPGDREKCIAAGASDVISKPVNVGQMLALLRTWLTRGR